MGDVTTAGRLKTTIQPITDRRLPCCVSENFGNTENNILSHEPL